MKKLLVIIEKLFELSTRLVCIELFGEILKNFTYNIENMPQIIPWRNFIPKNFFALILPCATEMVWANILKPPNPMLNPVKKPARRAIFDIDAVREPSETSNTQEISMYRKSCCFILKKKHKDVLITEKNIVKPHISNIVFVLLLIASVNIVRSGFCVIVV